MRGIDTKKDEQDSAFIIKDTRALSEQVIGMLSAPDNVSIILGTLALLCVLMPAANDLALFAGFGLFAFIKTRKPNGLPARVPTSSGLMDSNDWMPGTITPRKARGIFYFGNERKTSNEIWFGAEDMRTHVLLFGTTGSGKTEALISLAYNALVQGSGLVYVDGKGDSSLWSKIFAIVRYMGREDDLLVVNFMTGARDIIGAQSDRLSNTMNPFSTGSSSMLSNLITSLMEEGGGDGMWKGRAIGFIEALLKILVYCRDHRGLLLDSGVIRDAFHLPVIERIVHKRELFFENRGDMVYRLDDASIDNETIEIVLEPITNYLLTLPGYKPKDERGGGGKAANSGADKANEQHGYITMQLTRIFGSLSDTYRHITKAELAEVDFNDVIMNRRILVVLLPALEKSPDELANLGKIIIASLKAMMAAGLGSKLEGTYREVIESKPTNAPTPFVCVLDEYGYYAVEGFAVVAAQARSLGFSAVFAGQDIPAFEKASKEEAASIVGNTSVKIAMKVEEQQTFDLFKTLSGEAYVAHTSGWQRNVGGIGNSYQGLTNASIEKRSILDIRDLKAQREGEATIVWKDEVIRVDMFYANPPQPQKMKVNTFLRIKAPNKSAFVGMGKDFQEFSKKLLAGIELTDAPVFDGIDEIVQSFEINGDKLPLTQCGAAAFYAFVCKKRKDDEDFMTKFGLAGMSSDGALNIFGGAGEDDAETGVSDDFADFNLQQDAEVFGSKDQEQKLDHLLTSERQVGFLNEGAVKAELIKIEKSIAEDRDWAVSEQKVVEFVSDMGESTTYFSGEKPAKTPETEDRFKAMLDRFGVFADKDIEGG